MALQLGCPLCGLYRAPRFFGMREDGSYDPEARPPKLEAQLITSEGKNRLRRERQDVSVEVALGLRAALKAALARVETDLAEAGVTLED